MQIIVLIFKLLLSSTIVMSLLTTDKYLHKYYVYGEPPLYEILGKKENMQSTDTNKVSLQ